VKTSIKLTVKQRRSSFLSGTEVFDVKALTDTCPGIGLLVRIDSMPSPYGDMVTNVIYDYVDINMLEMSLNKLYQEKFNKEFTQALEEKISED
jgi:hypothetical protein